MGHRLYVSETGKCLPQTRDAYRRGYFLAEVERSVRLVYQHHFLHQEYSESKIAIIRPHHSLTPPIDALASSNSVIVLTLTCPYSNCLATLNALNTSLLCTA